MVAQARGLRVRDLVKRQPVTITPQATLIEAADMLTKHGVGALVVVDSAQLDKAIAVLSERDIVRAISMRMPLSTPVEAFMSTGVVSIEADESVSRAVELMWNYNIRHIVVTEGGRLVGVLSIRDVANPQVLSRLCSQSL